MSNVPVLERVSRIMSNSGAQPVERDQPPDGARGWRAHVPVVAFVFVVVCLLTLAVTPIVMIRRLDGLQRVANGTVGAARPIAGDLRLLFVEESDDHQRYILERDTQALARYRAHRSDERHLFIRLAALAGEIGSPTDADVDELRSRADRWHALTDLQVEQRISPAALAAALPRLTAGRDSVLAASAQVRADLNRAYDLDTAKGTAILDDQRLVSATLGILALLTTLVIAWFARRERALARALARAVAEEARLRAESERRREELERITETKNGLIRGFTHDVKNPIGAADGYLQLLAEGLLGPLGEKQRTGVERAHRSLASALELIGDLLELSRAEAANFHVELVPTNVVEVVRDAAEEYRAQAEAKRLTLTVDCDENIPVIRSDPGRVRQVLGNLISNAVKYTAAGSVNVRVRARVDAGVPMVVVEVADTGPGIPKEKQHLVFREFVRLDPSAAAGAGIGLAISERIVSAIGGSIEMTSEVGRGSTFVLSLPVGETAPLRDRLSLQA
jgi:signal transduction histidine kinase